MHRWPARNHLKLANICCVLTSAVHSWQPVLPLRVQNNNSNLIWQGLQASSRNTLSVLTNQPMVAAYKIIHVIIKGASNLTSKEVHKSNGLYTHTHVHASRLVLHSRSHGQRGSEASCSPRQPTQGNHGNGSSVSWPRCAPACTERQRRPRLPVAEGSYFIFW